MNMFKYLKSNVILFLKLLFYYHDRTAEKFDT